MAVAVVLSEGGNQAEEIKGGAAIIVTPLIPFRIAQMWQLDKDKHSTIKTTFRNFKRLGISKVKLSLNPPLILCTLIVVSDGFETKGGKAL